MGGTDTDRALHGAAVLGDCAIRCVGIRRARRAVFGPRVGHEHRTIPVHTHFNTGRDADVDDHAGIVGYGARARGRRTAPDFMGDGDLDIDRARATVEGVDRSGVSGGDGVDLSGVDEATAGEANVAEAAAVLGDPVDAGNRCAVARAGNDPQSAVFRFHDAQREGLVPRVLLVLFHERACAAVLEPTLPAGL